MHGETSDAESLSSTLFDIYSRESTTSSLGAQPLPYEAYDGAHVLAPPSSSPPEAGIAMARADELMAAFKDAVHRYYQGIDNGPYCFCGEFSLSEFERLVSREPKWRLAYDKETRQILLCGDPALPHEAAIASVRETVRAAAASFADQLAATNDAKFNKLKPCERAMSLVKSRGAKSRNVGMRIKQADELVKLAGVANDSIALAIEVAFCNESSTRAAEETLDWVSHGHAEFALAVKIEKNTINQHDPFLTVFFCDRNERRSFQHGSGSRQKYRDRRVIHEWPCGSGSAIASADLETSTRLNLTTMSSPITSNPAPVRYSNNFDAEVVFQGDGDPNNILHIPVGRSWTARPRAQCHKPKFVDADWDQLEGFVVQLNLAKLREQIVDHMEEWIEAGCPS